MDITVTELKQRIENKENVLIIDVREPWEYEEYNIGAQLIPLDQIPESIELLEAHRSDEIIIHCRSGKRSHQAVLFLKSKGFMNPRNLLGGMLEWKAHEDTNE